MAAYRWAVETLTHPKWGEKFAVFAEDPLDDPPIAEHLRDDTQVPDPWGGDGVPASLEEEDREGKRAEALALRCWPKQTTLTPTSGRLFYEQQSHGIPFEPLLTHLAPCERPRYGPPEVAAFLERWWVWASREPVAEWHPGRFRRELKEERRRWTSEG